MSIFKIKPHSHVLRIFWGQDDDDDEEEEEEDGVGVVTGDDLSNKGKSASKGVKMIVALMIMKIMMKMV